MKYILFAWIFVFSLSMHAADLPNANEASQINHDAKLNIELANQSLAYKSLCETVTAAVSSGKVNSVTFNISPYDAETIDYLTKKLQDKKYYYIDSRNYTSDVSLESSQYLRIYWDQTSMENDLEKNTTITDSNILPNIPLVKNKSNKNDEQFTTTDNWKISIDGGFADSEFSDSDTQTKCNSVVKLLLNSGWNSANAHYVNTPGSLNGGISVGYDLIPLWSNEKNWTLLTGLGYRYYGGPESEIFANASATDGYFNGSEDVTTDLQSFYIFVEPTFHFNIHHAIFARIELGVSEFDYEDNYTFYNSTNTNPNSSLDETDEGFGVHFAGLVGYQFTPWRHFAFSISAGLHEDYITNITIQSISASNTTTTDKVGSAILGTDGNPLIEQFIGLQSNVSVGFIW